MYRQYIINSNLCFCIHEIIKKKFHRKKIISSHSFKLIFNYNLNIYICSNYQLTKRKKNWFKSHSRDSLQSYVKRNWPSNAEVKTKLTSRKVGQVRGKDLAKVQHRAGQIELAEMVSVLNISLEIVIFNEGQGLPEGRGDRG